MRGALGGIDVGVDEGVEDAQGASFAFDGVVEVAFCVEGVSAPCFFESPFEDAVLSVEEDEFWGKAAFVEFSEDVWGLRQEEGVADVEAEGDARCACE